MLAIVNYLWWFYTISKYMPLRVPFKIALSHLHFIIQDIFKHLLFFEAFSKYTPLQLLPLHHTVGQMRAFVELEHPSIIHCYMGSNCWAPPVFFLEVMRSPGARLYHMRLLLSSIAHSLLVLSGVSIRIWRKNDWLME